MILIKKIWLLQSDESTILIDVNYEVLSQKSLERLRIKLRATYECKDIFFKYINKTKKQNK